MATRTENLRWVGCGLLCGLLTAFLILLSLLGCVATSGDIDEIGQHHIDAGEAILQAIPAAQSGALDLPGAMQLIGRNLIAAGEGTQAVGAGIEYRSMSMLGSLTGSLNTPGGTTLIAAIVTTIGGVLLNRHRNKTRVKAIKGGDP